MFNFTLSIDQETDAVDTVVGFAHKGFLTPDTKRTADLMVFVGQQRKVQQLFFGKTRQLFRLIGTDTQHFDACALQLVHVVAQTAGLYGTAWRHGFRVEVDQNTLSLEVG